MNIDFTERTLWFGWIAILLLSPLYGWLLRGRWPKISRIWRCIILAGFFISLLLAFCAHFTPWSLRGFWANTVNLALAYISLSALIWLVFMRASKWVSIAAPLFFSALSILPILIGLVFVGDEIPRREFSFGGHLVGHIYERGWGGSDFDEVIVVYQPLWIPLIEKTIYNRSVDPGECNHLLLQPASISVEKPIQIVCGQRIIETVSVQ
jgi:hypothetical protein